MKDRYANIIWKNVTWETITFGFIFVLSIQNKIRKHAPIRCGEKREPNIFSQATMRGLVEGSEEWYQREEVGWDRK